MKNFNNRNSFLTKFKHFFNFIKLISQRMFTENIYFLILEFLLKQNYKSLKKKSSLFLTHF